MFSKHNLTSGRRAAQVALHVCFSALFMSVTFICKALGAPWGRRLCRWGACTALSACVRCARRGKAVLGEWSLPSCRIAEHCLESRRACQHLAQPGGPIFSKCTNRLKGHTATCGHSLCGYRLYFLYSIWGSAPNHLPLQQQGYDGTALCMDTRVGYLTEHSVHTVP